MKFPHLNHFILITLFLQLFCIVFASSNCTQTITFIKKECNATRFQNSCITTLVPFACKIKPGDQTELCRVALNTSVGTSQNALQMLLNMSQESNVKGNTTEVGVISDCIDTYLTIIDYIMMASQMMNTRVINESTLVNLKLQISGLIESIANWESQCLKKVDGQHVVDSLRKRIYGVVVPCIKLNKIISTLVNRIHFS
ncbi:hypothetical protein RND81_05G074300 [Saponaria officinalis]|uniref:Pectinesterase inhibitor domain-containing protein n=1 Tax=Saponaria officinalis TaxID=3572 RepID=A0AAW1KQX2_SAPOF